MNKVAVGAAMPNHKSEIDMPVKDARPELFGPDGRLAACDILKVRTDLSAQLLLHWISASSLPSIYPEMAREIIATCVEMGGDALSMSSVKTLRTRGIPFRAYIWDELIGKERADAKLISSSPLGNSILDRNTQALMLLLEMNAVAGDANSDRPLARVQLPDGQRDLDAWSLCAIAGLHMPLGVLDGGFQQDSDSPMHQRRLGRALLFLLQQQVAHPERQRDSGNYWNNHSLVHLVRQFLIHGALPDREQMKSSGLDPAYLVGVLCESNQSSHLRALQRLVDAEYPLDVSSSRIEQPLHTAAKNDNAPALICLLDAGANPHLPDSRGLGLQASLVRDGRNGLLDILRIWTAKRLALDTISGLFNAYSISRRISEEAGVKTSL